MDFLPFFLGSGKIRYWYLIFYLCGLPLYLYGLLLLASLQANVAPQTREYTLTIFSFGYLLLGAVSFINTLLYAKTTGNYFKAFFIFLGIQVFFWMFGNILGNNYTFLTVYFFFFLCIAIYANLKALSYVKQFSLLSNYHKK